jgi:hypothetical protein
MSKPTVFGQRNTFVYVVFVNESYLYEFLVAEAVRHASPDPLIDWYGMKEVAPVDMHSKAKDVCLDCITFRGDCQTSYGLSVQTASQQSHESNPENVRT